MDSQLSYRSKAEVAAQTKIKGVQSSGGVRPALTLLLSLLGEELLHERAEEGWTCSLLGLRTPSGRASLWEESSLALPSFHENVMNL